MGSGKTCGDCIYFDGDYHLCRRNAPVEQGLEKPLFPEVCPDTDWCGELKITFDDALKAMKGSE